MQLPSNLTQSEGYTFGFTPAGRFTLLNREGEDLCLLSSALLQKLASHLLWILFWLVLSRFHPWLFAPVFFHLLLFGSRLTSLLIYGAIKPLLFPPLWERLSRSFFRGGGIELLRAHGLEDHPGLLLNLAAAQAARNDPQAAEATLAQACGQLEQHQPRHRDEDYLLSNAPSGPYTRQVHRERSDHTS